MIVFELVGDFHNFRILFFLGQKCWGRIRLNVVSLHEYVVVIGIWIGLPAGWI